MGPVAAFESLAGHQRDRDRADDIEAPLPEPELPPGKRTLLEEQRGVARPDDRAADLRHLRRSLHAMQGSGAPLPAGLSAEYSRLLDADLSAVRIHASGPASDAAAQLGARAFTHGSQIAFAPGQYDPSSAQTRHILAHELVHVVQNLRAGSAAMQLAARLEVGPSGSELETEAEAGAHALAAGQTFAVGARAALPAISMFSGNESVPEPNQSIDPNATPNASSAASTSTDPSAITEPNQSIDPNATPATGPNASTAASTSSEPNQSVDPNAGGANASNGTNGANGPTPGSAPTSTPDAGVANGDASAGTPDASAGGEGGAGPAPATAPKTLDGRIAEILEARADNTARTNYQKGLGQVHALRLQSLQYAFQPSGFGHTLFQTLVFPTDALSDHWAQVYSANAYRGGTSFMDSVQATIEGLRGVLHIVGDLCSILSAWAGMVAIVAALIALIGAETGVLAVVGGAVAAIADSVAITLALAKMLLDAIDMLLGVLQMLILIIRARASKDPAERARFAQLLHKEAGDFAANVVGISAQLAVMVATAGVGAGMTKGITQMGTKGAAKTFGAELGKLLLPQAVLAPFAKMQFRTAFKGLVGNVRTAATGSAVGKGVKVAGGIRVPGAAQGAEGVLGISVLRRAANGRVTSQRQVIEFTTKNQMNGARVARVNQFLRKGIAVDAGNISTIGGTAQLVVQTKQPDASSIARPGGANPMQVPDKPSGALTTVMMWPSQLEAMQAAKDPLADAITRMRNQHQTAAEQAGPEIAAQVDAKLKEIADRRAAQSSTASSVAADAAEGKANSAKGAEQAGQGKDTKAKADAAKQKVDGEQKKVEGQAGKLQAPPPKDGVLGSLYNMTIGKIGGWVASAQTWVKNFVGKGLMLAAGFDKADLDLAGIENDMRTDATKDTESQRAAEDVSAQDSEVQQAVYTLMEGKDSDQQAAIQGMAETQAFIDALLEADRTLEEAITNGQLYMDEAAPIIQHELEIQTQGQQIDAAYVSPIIGYADAFTASLAADNTGAVAQRDANAVLDEMHLAFEGLDVSGGKSQVASLVTSFNTVRTQQIAQATSSANQIKSTIDTFIGTCDYAGVNANAQALDQLVADFDAADAQLIDDLYGELNKVLAAHQSAIESAIAACPEDGAATPSPAPDTTGNGTDSATTTDPGTTTAPDSSSPNMTPAEPAPNMTPVEPAPNMSPAEPN